MPEKRNIITRSGMQELEEELNDLKVNRRREIAQKIKEAREQGDLSENAEYDAAKDEQRDIEARIEEIENEVKILDMEDDEEIDYKIVGSTEANILGGTISNESPLGSALLGAGVGDVVKTETEFGVFEYKVLEIK